MVEQDKESAKEEAVKDSNSKDNQESGEFHEIRKQICSPIVNQILDAQANKSKGESANSEELELIPEETPLSQMNVVRQVTEQVKGMTVSEEEKVQVMEPVQEEVASK